MKSLWQVDTAEPSAVQPHCSYKQNEGVKTKWGNRCYDTFYITFIFISTFINISEYFIHWILSGEMDGELKSLEDAWLSSSVVESENPPACEEARGLNCLSGLIWVNLTPTNKVTHLQLWNPPESRPGWK